LYLLVRSSPILEYSPTVLLVITIVGATSAFINALCGLVQSDIKKIIAFSTLSQLGYMVLAVGLSKYDVSLFHVINHAFFKALLFLSAGSVIHSMADQQDIRRLGGLINFLPFTYTIMLIGSLSLLATPWLSGFYSKDVRGDNIKSKFTVISKEIRHFPPLLKSLTHCTFGPCGRGNMSPTLELVERENLNMNRASLVITYQSLNLLGGCYQFVGLSMIKAKLLKVYYSLSSRIGNNLDRDRIIELLNSLNLWLLRWESLTRCILNTFKSKSKQSKESVRVNKATAGLPKGINSYGSRVIIVPVNKYVVANTARNRGRVTVDLYLKFRSYSTGSDTAPTKGSHFSQIKVDPSNGSMWTEANIKDKLKDLYLRSKTHPNTPIDRKLYKLMCDVNILKLAYEKLKSKPGHITLTPETLEGISIESLESITSKLKSEEFQFKTGRIIKIPKASGSISSLTMKCGVQVDNLVQEAMRLILEQIYEPLFLDSSHGFRPNRSSHTALKTISKQFQSSTWIIEGALTKSNCLNRIDHHKLMTLIESKILDRKFTRLIWKSLRAGHLEFANESKKYHNNLGTLSSGNLLPYKAGSIISPILYNIFMTQFDSFMEEQINNYDHTCALLYRTAVKESRKSKESSRSFLKAKAKKAGEPHKESLNNLAKDKFPIPAPCAWSYPSDNRDIKLSYIRYADDWIVGVKGTIKDAKEISNKIDIFLTSLGLTLRNTKPKIVNISKSEILFLGTKIYRAKDNKYVRIVKTSSIKTKINTNTRRLRLDAPMIKILSKLHDADFMRKNKSHPKFVWMNMEHPQIILRYNAVLREYLNYYKFSHNYRTLASSLLQILKSSCAKLLAAKYSLNTQVKVYDKFGPLLTAKNKANKSRGCTKCQKCRGDINFLKPNYKRTFKF
jgi:retron-type reverse transcriptase